MKVSLEICYHCITFVVPQIYHGVGWNSSFWDPRLILLPSGRDTCMGMLKNQFFKIFQTLRENYVKHKDETSAQLGRDVRQWLIENLATRCSGMMGAVVPSVSDYRARLNN